MKKVNTKQRLKKLLIGVAVAVFCLVVAGIISLKLLTYQANETALKALQSDELVTVEQNDWIVFEPNQEYDTALIFYPGGLVEPESYALLCREIAEAGNLVVIVPMTANLAVLSPNRGEEVLAAYPNVEHWFIGGHSLGGVMAADFATEHDEIEGVVLYASYPQGDDLADTNLTVVSIYGSLDGVAKLDKVKNATLPEGATWEVIEGGNHAQFGSYGAQKGDNEATISNEEQIARAAEVTIEVMDGENE